MGSLAPSAESSSTVQTTGSMTPSESSPEIQISTTTTAVVADREICGICLGPCKGHHSRLTPCNHAICPPCVEKAHQQSSKQVGCSFALNKYSYYEDVGLITNCCLQYIVIHRYTLYTPFYNIRSCK